MVDSDGGDRLPEDIAPPLKHGHAPSVHPLSRVGSSRSSQWELYDTIKLPRCSAVAIAVSRVLRICILRLHSELRRGQSAQRTHTGFNYDKPTRSPIAVGCYGPEHKETRNIAVLPGCSDMVTCTCRAYLITCARSQKL